MSRLYQCQWKSRVNDLEHRAFFFSTRVFAYYALTSYPTALNNSRILSTRRKYYEKSVSERKFQKTLTDCLCEREKRNDQRMGKCTPLFSVRTDNHKTTNKRWRFWWDNQRRSLEKSERWSWKCERGGFLFPAWMQSDESSYGNLITGVINRPATPLARFISQEFQYGQVVFQTFAIKSIF